MLRLEEGDFEVSRVQGEGWAAHPCSQKEVGFRESSRCPLQFEKLAGLMSDLHLHSLESQRQAGCLWQSQGRGHRSRRGIDRRGIDRVRGPGGL